ncbi:AAA family ATPase [Corynebacterium guangdongense]|nr:AAA family ATPase [Corynebacterium guangdongense]
MGLSQGSPVAIDTSNSTPNLERLFSIGAEKFFIPIAHTSRYSERAADASRSVIQTNVRQWKEGTGTKDFSHLLDVREDAGSKKLIVSLRHSYPEGLGTNENGFANKDGIRVAIPITAWAIWYGRKSAIPDRADPGKYLVDQMISELNLTRAESENVFIEDSPPIETDTSGPVSDETLQLIAKQVWNITPSRIEISDSLEANKQRVAMNQTVSNAPSWLNVPPESQLNDLLEAGRGALLLTGPPRTGKTRAIKNATGNLAKTIQIHDGWAYANLILGQTLENGQITWTSGPLLDALRSNDEFIILEEINRTRISQALGEVFSLLEDKYRGTEHAVRLADGTTLSISPETRIFLTMNTLDASTEDVDDALFGRVRSVYFPPRIEDLSEILYAAEFSSAQANKWKQFFVAVQEHYPLGHGYFADLLPEEAPASFYRSAIRPVLANHFEAFAPDTLAQIDTLFDEILIHG